MNFEKRHIIGLAVSLAIFLLMALSYNQSEPSGGLEAFLYDFSLYLMGHDAKTETFAGGVKMGRGKRGLVNPNASKKIVILGYDEGTVRNFSDRKIQWPIPWKEHAQFINFVSSGNPAALSIDFMFLDPKKDKDKLAQAVKNAENVILSYPFEIEAVDSPYNDIEKRMELLNTKIRFPADPEDTGAPLVEEAVPPLPELVEAAKGIGFANVFPGKDKSNRKMPLILKHKKWYYPNTDLLTAMQYYGISKQDVEIKYGKYIKLKNIPLEKMARPNKEKEIIIPIDERGFMDINFIGGSGSFTNYPFYLFNREGSMGNNTSLKGKIILVGMYNPIVQPIGKKTPFGYMYEIEVHAQALNTILNQDFITRISWVSNIIIMLIIALVLGLLIPRIPIWASVILQIVGMISYYGTGLYLLMAKDMVIAMNLPLIQIGVSVIALAVVRAVAAKPSS
ncbi:MAG: CHASE2 domain-containing protein [bacterium]|nr:CHASE2 domain-containing protein [bacterium]